MTFTKIQFTNKGLESQVIFKVNLYFAFFLNSHPDSDIYETRDPKIDSPKLKIFTKCLIGNWSFGLILAILNIGTAIALIFSFISKITISISPMSNNTITMTNLSLTNTTNSFDVGTSTQPTVLSTALTAQVCFIAYDYCNNNNERVGDTCHVPIFYKLFIENKCFNYRSNTVCGEKYN